MRSLFTRGRAPILCLWGGPLAAIIFAVLAIPAAWAQPARPLPDHVQEQMLKRYPESDLNGDGVLTRTELRDFRIQQRENQAEPGSPWHRRRMRRMSPEQILAEHPEYDRDGDGELSAEELDEAYQNVGRPRRRNFRPNARFFDWLLDHFAEADLDGNQMLSREELQTLKQRYTATPRRQHGRNPAETLVLEQFPEADTDGDGQLSSEEFKTYRQGRPHVMRDALLKKYPDADADGDGDLNEDEYRQARQRFRTEMREQQRSERPGPRPGDASRNAPAPTPPTQR